MLFFKKRTGLGLIARISLLFLMILIGIFITAIFFYLASTESQQSGKRVIQGVIDPVTISFDLADIPHIKANSPSDAIFALGYIHATERSWQMEINRRLASGRLSEILGTDTVPIDRFMRTIGIKRSADRQLDRYPIEAKRLLQAYADGVNAGNASLGWALPIEYFLTRSKPGYWSSSDSVAWMLMMSLDLGGNWQKELQRLELSQYLTTEEIWQVFPPYTKGEPVTQMDFAKFYKDLKIFNSKRQNKSITETVIDDEEHASSTSSLPGNDFVLNKLLPGGNEGIGSNNWAISGKKTASGKPLLANDPHLGLSTPAIWYFAHLDAPGLNVIGATIPGIPAVVLGRTDKFAWSFTNTGPDVQDLYIEKLDSEKKGMYRGPDGPLSFRVHQEIIDIKDRPPLRFLVKDSRHGPIISDAYQRAKNIIDTDRFALSLRWTALDVENQSVVGLLEMNRSINLDSFKEALRKNYAPMQNVVMADLEGNISYQAAGAAPKRTLHQGLYGVAPAPGWEKQHDWTGYIPFEQLPSSNNPNQGWIATANQQIISENNPNPLTGDWELPMRYERIASLIQKKDRHDIDSMHAMQGDTFSLGAVPLLDLFKSSKPQHELGTMALNISKDFDGDMKSDSAAALIFNAWVDQLTRRLFSRLGYIFKEEYGKRHFRDALLEQVKDPNSPWCDKPETEQKETCSDASNEAYDKALDELVKSYGSNPQKWSWGNAHIAISEHRPFSKVPLLARLFNIETPIPGDTFTINVGKTELGQAINPYEVKQASSLRAIYDLSDLEQSSFIYQAGQSGWVQSKLYRNMNPLWAKNETLPLQMKPATSKRQLLLSPR